MTESNEGFDSTSSSDVQAANPPAGAVIFGYANGEFAWTEEDWAKFPEPEFRRATIGVYIPGEDITGLDCDLLDVEAQYLADKSPNRTDCLNQSTRWAVRRREEHKTPGFYTSADSRELLEATVGTGAGWFLADWAGVEHQAAGEGVLATQDGSPSVPLPGEGHWDDWDIDNAAFDAWYAGNHSPAPAPTPEPAEPAQPPKEGTVNVTLPQLAAPATGPSVKAAQQLLKESDPNLAVDGVFGPLTHAAVEAFQAAHELAQDGVIGVHTWGALLGNPQ